MSSPTYYSNPSYYSRLESNTLIQLNSDYGYISRFPLLNKKLKNKLQTAQNKCISHCLDLPLALICGATDLRKINWLLPKSLLTSIMNVPRSLVFLAKSSISEPMEE